MQREGRPKESTVPKRNTGQKKVREYYFEESREFVKSGLKFQCLTEARGITFGSSYREVQKIKPHCSVSMFTRVILTPTNWQNTITKNSLRLLEENEKYLM